MSDKGDTFKLHEPYPDHYDCFGASLSYIVLDSKGEVVKDEHAPIFYFNNNIKSLEEEEAFLKHESMRKY